MCPEVASPASAACAPTLISDAPGVVVVDGCDGSDDEFGAITVTEDGHVVMVGITRTDGMAKLIVARVTPSGTLDTSLSGDGVIIDGDVGADIAPSGVMVTGEGHVVVIGTARRPDTKTRAFVAVKYTNSGDRDASFGDNGLATARLQAGGDDSSSGGAMGPDDTVVVGGTTRATSDSPTEITAYRYENNGKPDTGFGANGAAATRITAGAGVLAGGLGVAGVDVYQDGTVVLAGTVQAAQGVPAQLVLVQYDTNGAADSAFDKDGIVQSSADGVPVQDVVLVLQGDGSIVVAGKAGERTALARFSSTGERDESFNKDGTAVDLGGEGDIIALGTTEAGEVLLMGSSRTADENSQDLVVLRFDGKGELDTSYADGGTARTKLSGNRDFHPVSVALGTDHGVAAGGTAGAKGKRDLVVARLDPAGKPETTFGSAAHRRN
ncbi:hypothetical protein GCM10022267_27790 [Lentzea roselyniae]|uniref:Delta-60 repeat domain-containing protein n=2 Tax=Lentzea roselyniae TaxID=531940 RepID=A0ABP7ASR6_9PSEU